MRPESRWMTLGDAMTLSVGVALAFAIERLPGMAIFYYPLATTAYVMILLFLMVWASSMAISAAALARSARHRRPIGPGEWLASLMAASGVVGLHPQALMFAEQPLVIRYGIDFSAARWIIAAAWTLVMIVGFAALAAISRRVPPLLNAVGVLGLAIIALGGPLAVVQKEVPFLLSPFGDLGGSSAGLLAIQAQERIAETPVWLMFAVPTIALASRWPGRRSWPWTEWAGAIACTPIMAYALFQRDTFFRPMSGFWFADQAFGLAWLGFVLLLAWWIHRRWSNRVQPSPPAASTSST
ncbi:hypothetical protein TA3x_004417 [Tundrisphaera sp. TA3]|uniref:hypothetical protein n=1 Tax=Tundrisphaera sp. TA3 TaxID=3435775 RepID=UPI003EBCB7DF